MDGYQRLNTPTAAPKPPKTKKKEKSNQVQETGFVLEAGRLLGVNVWRWHQRTGEDPCSTAPMTALVTESHRSSYPITYQDPGTPARRLR